VQLADLVERVVTENVERPLRARLLAPIRVFILRRFMRTVVDDNELTHMPYEESPVYTAYENLRPDNRIRPMLAWPTNRLLPTRRMKPVEVPDGFWRVPPNDDLRHAEEELQTTEDGEL
jgi:hypothetical protein